MNYIEEKSGVGMYKRFLICFTVYQKECEHWRSRLHLGSLYYIAYPGQKDMVHD